MYLDTWDVFPVPVGLSWLEFIAQAMPVPTESLFEIFHEHVHWQ